MARFTSHPPGTPCWVDLMSPDVDSSKEFYTAVFGWDAADEFDGDQRVYTLFKVEGLNAAGLGGQPSGTADMPPVWNTYVAVADCAETAKAVEAAGGTVVMAPMQVMTAGEMAIFADPGGAVFSVWNAGGHIGAQIGNEPDTYSWNELMSRDVDTAKTFYSAVFGWTYEELDMGPAGTYSVIAGGEHNGLGGLMAMPPDMPDMVPNHWAVYFTVADIEATISKVTGNGGQVVVPPTPIPGVGTMAHVHDPDGGSFALLEPQTS